MEKQQNNEENKKKTKKQLTRKSLMLLLAGLMVVVVLTALAIAWYTRVANSYSVTFSLTDYDLAINKNQDDTFVLDVYNYAQVTKKKMAPGTVGWLPVEISAKFSQVDINFTVAIDNLMPDEIKRHFRIFALMEEKIDPETGLPVVDPDTGETVYVYHYGEALTEEEDIADYKKYYIDSIDDTVNDDITKGDEKLLCIYWEWYLDAARADEDHPEKDSDGHYTYKFFAEDGSEYTADDFTILSTDDDDTKAAKIALFSSIMTRWNELDTDIGRYPAKYTDAMQMVLHGTGAQIKPSDGVRESTTAPETTTEEE